MYSVFCVVAAFLFFLIFVARLNVLLFTDFADLSLIRQVPCSP